MRKITIRLEQDSYDKLKALADVSYRSVYDVAGQLLHYAIENESVFAWKMATEMAPKLEAELRRAILEDKPLNITDLEA